MAHENEVYINMTPEEFGKAVNGRESSNGFSYQMLIIPGRNGEKDKIVISHLDEITPGKEFSLKIRIVEDQKNGKSRKSK